MSDFVITDIILCTENIRPHGQDIVVYAELDDGARVELMREFGALPDVSVYHRITHHGISEAIKRQRRSTEREGV